MAESSNVQVDFNKESGCFRIRLPSNDVQKFRDTLLDLEKQITAYAKRSGFSSFAVLQKQNGDGSQELVLLPASKTRTEAELGAASGDKIAELNTAESGWKKKLTKELALGKHPASSAMKRPKGKGVGLRTK